MKFTRSELSLILILSSIQFAHIIDFVILMPLGPQLMRSLQINPSQFGLLVSIYTLAAGLSGLAASLYIDRFDRKKVLLLFFVGFTVGTFGCAFAPNYHSLLTVRFFTGAFGGVLTSIVMSIVSDAFEYSRRGSALGFVMSAFAVASVLGIPLGLYLANLNGWQTPFYILGFLCLPLFLLVFLFVPKQDAHLKTRQSNDPFKIFKMIKEDRNQQISLALIFFLVLGQFTVIPFISSSFVLNAGLAESLLPMIYLLGGICSMFAAPIAGRLADRYGKHKVFRISILFSLIAIYMITNLGPQKTWFIFLVSCAFFVVMSGRMVPSMALITSTVSTEMRAGFLAIVSAMQQLSSAAASWIAGMIIIENSQGYMENFNYVGYLAIASSLFTFFMITKVKSTFAH